MKVFGLFVFIFLCFQAYPLESKLNGTIDKIWNHCGFNSNTTRASRSKTKKQTIDFNFINNWFTDYSTYAYID